MSFTFPKDYPFKPPSAKFITKVYHPNIYFCERICCFSSLCDQWSPALTINKVMDMIINLVEKP